MIAVSTFAYTRVHTSVYVTDKMRNLLKLLVRHHGLNPQRVVEAWTDWVERAMRTWLESGHLCGVIIEFYWPGSNNAVARWDFPVRYDGSDIEEMWVDRPFFEDSFAKAKVPPVDCSYRIVLEVLPQYPFVEGMGHTVLRSVDGLVAREVGTVIATPDIMASARYYRA